jgi:hypothetical protein
VSYLSYTSQRKGGAFRGSKGEVKGAQKCPHAPEGKGNDNPDQRILGGELSGEFMLVADKEGLKLLDDKGQRL